MSAPGWCYGVFAVDGELAESFPTYPPTGWRRRACCCPAAVAWECGAGAGPMDEGIVVGCSGLAEGSD